MPTSALDVAHPAGVRPLRGEVPLEQVGELRCGLVLPGQPVPALDPPRHQALAAHRVRDRLLADLPAHSTQIVDQPGRAVQPPRLAERDPHGPVDGVAAPVPRRVQAAGRGRPTRATEPLVEPRQADAEQGAADGVWHPVAGPLVGDEACHAHFVASLTHRTTDRLRTSRSIRSSATSTRSRLSSSMSSFDNPLVPSAASRARFTQLPSVPSFTPRSRATWAIGFPVSSTIRTAPSRNSRSYFFRISGISIPIVDASTVRGEPQRFWSMLGVCRVISMLAMVVGRWG